LTALEALSQLSATERDALAKLLTEPPAGP
jgi:hypothetical protein